MIHVTVFRKKNGYASGFSVRGHAECGDYGEDLVCAAVSAVVQTAILGVTDVLHLKADYRIENGNTVCTLDPDIPEEAGREANLLIETMLAGLYSIREGYPKALQIFDKEV